MPPAIIVLAHGMPPMSIWLACVSFGLILSPPVAVIAYCIREIRSWRR